MTSSHSPWTSIHPKYHRWTFTALALGLLSFAATGVAIALNNTQATQPAEPQPIKTQSLEKTSAELQHHPAAQSCAMHKVGVETLQPSLSANDPLIDPAMYYGC